MYEFEKLLFGPYRIFDELPDKVVDAVAAVAGSLAEIEEALDREEGSGDD